MPAPTLTGTAAAVTETTAASIDLTMTVPADANVICVAFGGYAGSSLSVTSVQGDPTGTPYNINDITLYGQRAGTEQYAGFYAIYDTNVNWPGAGSVTIRVTIATGNRQLKGCIFCLKDVNTAGTPTNDTDQTGAGAASTPSITLTSSSNALNVAVAATYSADTSGGGDDTAINSQQNGAGSSSLYTWYESGTGASDTIEASGSVDWAMMAVSFEGTGGGGGGGSTKLMTLLGVG